MTLPLSHPEKESAVIGYIVGAGFRGIADPGRTRPETFTNLLRSLIWDAALCLHRIGKTPNGINLAEVIEADSRVSREAKAAAEADGLPDFQTYLAGVDNSLSYMPDGGQIVGEYLADIAEAAGRRKAVEIGRRLADGEILPSEAAEALGRIQNAGAGFKPLSLRSPLEILKMQFDPADLLLENGYLVKGSPLTILGQGGLGKSRFTLQLAVCSILGRDFLGWKTSGADVKWLFLQTENGCRRLKADLGKMMAGLSKAELSKLDANLRIHTIEHDEDTFVSLGSDLGRERVKQTINGFPADVVVFDVLRDFGIGDLNSDADMAATCGAIGGVVRQGNPQRIPLVVHHATTGRAGIAKASGFDRSSFGRNSKVLLGWTRAQINLAPHGPDSNDVVIVTSGKANDFEEFKPFAVRLNTDTWQYEPAPDIDIEEWKQAIAGKGAGRAATASLSDVVEQTRKAGIDGISKAGLVQAVIKETGCGKSKAYDLVKEAEKCKAVHRRKSDELYVCK